VNHSKARQFSRWVACCALAGLCNVTAQAEEILLWDDFSGPVLNTATWGLANWTIGDRTQFGNTPEFSVASGVGYVSLPLDTYNPNFPGQRVLGTEIYSLQNFDNTGGIEYLARARLSTGQPGLVAAFFTYNQTRQKRTWISDEIDFEILSNQSTGEVLVTSWNDWGAPNSGYEDGIHHLGGYVFPGGYNWQDWNTYAMRWYPDRVEWYVNDALVETHTSPVPNLAQPARASLWAGGTTWPDAFSASLQPVPNPANNQRYRWDIDYIMVTRLSGGSSLPAAPTGLSATLEGSNVHLTWADTANNETSYFVYRAWKPKGKASPDFSAVASLGANAISYTDSNVPNGQYLYKVAAANASGESAPSNTITVTVGTGGKP